ncbi:MAG: endoribonuclease Nob1 [Thermoproteota archaeon]|nr:endoribonuclease Nob1 [Thermoproteota archaeon]
MRGGGGISKKVIVLDTSAFLMGYNPLSIEEEQFAVNAVASELSFEDAASTRFRMAVDVGKVKLRDPSTKSVKKVEEVSKRLGDSLSLSEVDRGVLALALELKESGFTPFIVSDDYAVQNVADQLGIGYSSLSNFGIRYRFQWILVCPACHRRYPPTFSQKECSICGTILKRRVQRKIQAKGRI